MTQKEQEKQDQGPKVPTTLDCEQCTYENDVLDAECEMCGFPRPSDVVVPVVEVKVEKEEKKLQKKKKKAMRSTKVGAFAGPREQFNMRRINYGFEILAELVDFYRCLFSNNSVAFGDLWRDIFQAALTLDRASFVDYDQLPCTLATLAVLGGSVEPLRVGGRAIRNGTTGIISSIKWSFEAKLKDEKEKLVGLVHEASFVYEHGDQVVLTANQISGLKMLASVPVPYHRLDAQKILNVLTDFTFEHRLSSNSARLRVVDATLIRQSLKVISNLLARPVLAKSLLPRLDQLASMARAPAPLSATSLENLEERFRAFKYYEGTTVPQQNEEVKTVAASTGGKTGGNKNFDLTWKTDSRCANVTFEDDNHSARFNTNSSHRGIIAEQGFDSGVHEWQIELKQRPCCGFSPP